MNLSPPMPMTGLFMLSEVILLIVGAVGLYDRLFFDQECHEKIYCRKTCLAILPNPENCVQKDHARINA